jgi:hypothetical protein
VGHWRGSKKGAGRVGGRRGRETRRRARVRTRRSTAGAGKVGPRCRERKGDARGQRLGTGESGPQNRERAGEVTGADRLASLGSEREREGACERGTAADRRGPPVRQRGRAASLGLVGRLGCFLLLFFSGFSNFFPISFSIGFSNSNSN